MVLKHLTATASVILIALSASADAGPAIPSRVDLSSPASQAHSLRIFGRDVDSVTGITVSAGDVNGDGVEDVLFGALRASPLDRSQAGEAYVLFGSRERRTETVLDLSDSPASILRIAGAASGMQFGRSVAAGDMDGDGIGDLIVSAWYASPSGRTQAGKTYIIFGSPELASEGMIDLAQSRSDVIQILGQEAGDQFGILVAAGDVNGDGFADAIIGAGMARPYGRELAGSAHVVFGSADIRTRGTIDARDHSRVLAIDGEDFGYGSGYSGSGQLGYHVTAGDLNGDRIDDVILGARLADPLGRTDTGTAYVIFGAPNLMERQEIDLMGQPAGVLRIIGNLPGENTSDRMNTGDVDGDGFDDLLIGAAGAQTPNGYQAGKVYIVFGGASMPQRDEIDLSLADWPAIAVHGQHGGDLLSMPFCGDVNGDDIADFGVMAHSTVYGSRSHVGTGYAFFGSAGLRTGGNIDLRNPRRDMVRVDGDDANGYLGVSAASGDIDGDGFDDLIMAAHGSSPEGRMNAGKVYIVWGGTYTPVPPGAPTHFACAGAAGDSARVVIPADTPIDLFGQQPAPGDEIGIFTPGGVCAGAAVWTGENLTITVRGDDPWTEVVEGFMNGEPLVFRVWVSLLDREFDMIPRFASSTAAYWPGAEIALVSLEARSKPTGVDEEQPKPVALAQNHPNPFNPSTTISFTLPRAARSVVTVYNALGARIAVLADREMEAGTHQVMWHADRCAGGVYFCRLEADGFTETRKMLLVK